VNYNIIRRNSIFSKITGIKYRRTGIYMCQGGADMDKKEIRSSNILFLLKCLLFSYILTGGFLLLLALFLYKFQLSEKVVSIAIIGIYVVAVFFAGFMTGKRMGSKKFLWGLAVGLAYFAVMALVSFAANHGFKDLGTHFFTTLAICAAGGMLGGMLS
jgi:putative membrane protein, TIGR04086 family